MPSGKVSLNSCFIGAALLFGTPALAAGALDQISARLAPLNLTAAQQMQIDNLLAAEQPKFATLGKDLRHAEKGLLANRESPNQAATDVGNAVRNLALEIESLQSGLNQILTPDQQANMSSLKLEAVYKKLLTGGGKGGGGGGQHGGGGGGGGSDDEDSN